VELNKAAGGGGQTYRREKRQINKLGSSLEKKKLRNNLLRSILADDLKKKLPLKAHHEA